MSVAFFPPPDSILFTSQSERAALLFATLPIEIACIIAQYDGGWKHQESCPSALFYDPDFDEEWPAVSGTKTFCKLKHCPHDANPSIALVQINQHWRGLRTCYTLWATTRLIVDMDFRLVWDPLNLRVINMAEYAFCVRASGSHPFNVSIGCDPKQRQDLADGKPITRDNMRLDVDGVVGRLASLCFDASIGRLVTAMGLLDVDSLTSIYVAGGASDRYPSNMARLRDSRLFQSPGLERVYCSKFFDGATGPLVLSGGYNSIKVLDLSGAGEYHEVAVEYILHYCKFLEDFRITASTDATAHLETFVNGSGIIDGVAPIDPDAVVQLPLQHLRLTQHINAMTDTSTTPPFLSMFSFPLLQELVILHLDIVYPTDVSWLSRAPFPSLTYLQLNSEMVDHEMFRVMLGRMPALRELVIATNTMQPSRTSWGHVREPRQLQNNGFLQALRSAKMKKLEVLKLGGDCWFTREVLDRFLAVYDGVGYSLQKLTLGRWYGTLDGSTVNTVNMVAQRVNFRCAQVSHCNYAATNGARPPGDNSRDCAAFECRDCGVFHYWTKVDDVSVAGRRVQDRMRQYWPGV